MNYSKDFQDTVLKSSCHWIPDTPYAGAGKFLTEAAAKEANPNNPKYNQGYVDRRKGLHLGGWQEFNIMLPSDIVTCQRYLPPSYVVEVVLHRMSDDFLLICGDGNENNYKIELDNIHLTVDRYTVSQSVQSAYANGLKRGLKPSIPMSRNYIKAYPKQATQTDLGE